MRGQKVSPKNRKLKFIVKDYPSRSILGRPCMGADPLLPHLCGWLILFSHPPMLPDFDGIFLVLTIL